MGDSGLAPSAMHKGQIGDDGGLIDPNYNVDKNEMELRGRVEEATKLLRAPPGIESDVDGASISDPADLLERIHISDSKTRLPVNVGMPAAGALSPNRSYKMASDIFGTGMDRSWNAGTPQRATPQPMSPLTPPVRHRTEPASFKITEMPNSDNSAGGNDPNYSNTTRKARESAGNPLTGKGYNDGTTKTAKRYYEGSNANQKLW